MGKQTYIIAQKPNLPIIVWFVSFVLLQFFSIGVVHTLLALISFGAIFTWAWLEIFQGVNAFRKVLGGVVMAFILLSRIF